MNNNSWFKKEKPMVTLSGLGGGSASNLYWRPAGGGGGVSTSYVDEVFSTFLYTGNGSYPRTITNNIDFSNNDGLIIHKSRSDGYGWVVYDTVRGSGAKALRIDSQLGENSGDVGPYGLVDQFNSDGFRLNQPSSTDVLNGSNLKTASFSFRKAPGFFDVVTWTGNSDLNQTINHSLSSIPGMIIAKRTDSSSHWVVYHRGHIGYLRLNNSNGAVNDNGAWTPVTSTSFKAYDYINVDGASYVAYIFAGGESTAATAKSVDFDGNDYLIAPASSDLNIGSSDFTFESWVYPTNYGEIVSAFNQSSPYVGWLFGLNFAGNTGKMAIWLSEPSSASYHSNSVVPLNQWSHVAFTKSGTTYKFYLNGTFDGSFTSSITSSTSQQDVRIGADNNPTPSRYLTGKISNLRITKGQVLYTDSFRPSTEPLTTTSQGAIASNVKLLCCNNSSVTGATVIPTGSLSTYGDPSASTDDPFDDPNGFKFGEGNDQNVIKCGTFIPDSNGKATVNLGWEPQWWMWKKTSGAGGWGVYDAMRGVNAIGNDQYLEMHNPNAENSVDVLNFTSTGVDISLSAASHAGSTFLYVAVRRPDGYVGKPPTAGTDVFTIDQGNGSSTEAFTSGFPVDYAIWRQTNTTFDWYNSARKLANANDSEYVKLNSTDGSTTTSFAAFANNTGFHNYSSYGSNSHGWMWKRHAGMDVVIYTGNGNNTDGANAHAHGLGKPPEMIWIKTLNDGSYSGVTHWTMSHEGLNSGINPWQYTMSINNTWSETTTSNFGNTTPTSTHFYVGDPGNGRSNDNNSNYMAILFASVDGICKVGTYNGSSSTQTIQCGFQPRFFWQKRVTGTGEWHTCDTIRGWGSGNDQFLYFNATAGPGGYDFGAPTSTGFTITGGAATVSNTGEKYIFYAHA